MRGEKKRLTWVDQWAKHGHYVKNACMRMKRSDKKRCNRFMRNYRKQLIRESEEDE